MNRKKRAVKRNHIIELVAGLLIIISLNVISKYIFERFDMTAERRYSLSQATKDMLTNLDDVAFVRVYLEGDFPPDFKRLRNETREMLDEFRSWSKNIEYEFVNPLEGADKTAQQGIIQQLYDKGIRASVLTVDEDEGSSEKVIVPAAMVYYKGRETPIQLLKDQYGIPPEEVLNNSVQSLEYEISNAIRKLSIPIKQKIGFLEGHGELESILMADIMNALSEYYLVDRVAINEKLKALNEYQALVIAKPDSAFTEKDKFIIDQFVMRGGKVLWFIDPVWASMDSLQYNGHTIGFANRINLEDQLFKYGVRLNTTLAQDLMALPIPVVVGNIGSQKQISSKPWYFFPLLIPASGHPIVKNLNMVKTEFASTID
ncbi:MAG: gliding motility-associated ABC transporter substrate-binding protein GldG, partial [Bacteroidetes bacterium]|nr:gliding motility-associated ABC transporter substrate-binding protein GldG [Bacteroidota bacterium]MBU1718614.1 gliding motility-associated ABC transporter substrate-binding protein GldG [Bacteroidota bacterium]